MASNSSSSESWISPGAGITGGYDGDSETLRMFIVFFSGLAMYNACELVGIIFLVFKRYNGLYFWSMLVADLGIIPYSLGFLLKFMNITTGKSRYAAVVVITIGWWPMITGQSVVLWSRLHLIMSGSKAQQTITWTKWMIVANFFLLHIPTTVLTFGSNGHLATENFGKAYNVYEKIQMIGFFIQETILSSIYIRETIKLLHTSLQPGTRKTMRQLILINVIIIILDLGLLGLECASLYILEILLKGVIYSVKLKLEFAILGKLVKFVKGTKSKPEDLRKTSIGFITTDGNTKDDYSMDIEEFVDISRISSDYTHPPYAYRQSDSLASIRRSSRFPDAKLDYALARFAYVENISTIPDTNPTASVCSGEHGRVDAG